MNLVYFPVALYLRLFGAAGLGYIVARIGSQATYATLAIACLSFAATFIGWLMMRPLMREAKKTISRESPPILPTGDPDDIDA